MFAQHGYASHTPVSDGKRIYVYFGKTGALAFDLDGNQLWQTPIGTESDPRGWGSASSPILYGKILIITASAECEGLIGLDTETGKELWRQEAAGFNATWGTPVLVRVDDQRTDLVIGVPNEVWGFNPNTGKLRWYCQAMESDSYRSSVVAHEDIVFALEGRGGGAFAIRAGGKGAVSDSHVVWEGKHSNGIGTPLVFEGRLYFINRGIVSCVDAKTGKELFQERLVGGAQANQGQPGGGRGNGGGGGGRPGGRRGGGFGSSDYSSPVIAGGKLYFVTRTGNMYVLNAGDKFEQLAVNRVTDDQEDFSATPAISNGQLFIRSSRHMYCIAAEETSATESK
jgi:outer membrane protein assembly factor BamB